MNTKLTRALLAKVDQMEIRFNSWVTLFDLRQRAMHPRLNKYCRTFHGALNVFLSD